MSDTGTPAMKGHVLASRYELVAPLGAGGMGRVWRAHDRLLDRDVAVKVLAEAHITDAKALARFRSEARLAARLSHPCIVALHDFGTEGALPYIVMELVDGPSLAQALGGGPLPPRRAAEIGRHVALALAHAHAAGLVHRDVSPANVLLTGSGGAKVTDFGIARALAPDDEATTARLGSLLGTAPYVAPELARGEPATAASDLYALGVVLHEMLSGAPPFKGESAAETLALHLTAPPPPTGAPPVLAALVERLLAKKPGARPAGAADVAADLAAFVEGRALLTTVPLKPPASGVTDDDVWPPVPARRAPRLRGTLAALSLAAAAAAGGFASAVALAGGDGVPELEGRTLADARARAEAAGARVRVEEAHDDLPVGLVVEQSPRPGAALEPGETVTVVVSRGPQPETEPVARPVFDLFRWAFPRPEEPTTAERMLRDLRDAVGALFGR